MYYIPAGDAELKTKGFVPLQASDANSVVQDHYDDYDACNVRARHEWAAHGIAQWEDAKPRLSPLPCPGSFN